MIMKTGHMLTLKYDLTLFHCVCAKMRTKSVICTDVYFVVVVCFLAPSSLRGYKNIYMCSYNTEYNKNY